MNNSLPAALANLRLGSGIAAVIFGLVAMFWPGATLSVVAILFGFYLVVSGVAQLLAASFAGSSSGHTVLLVLSGALSLILGVISIRDLTNSLILLAIWIGIAWLFRGATLLGIGASLPEGHRLWPSLLGVVLVIAGIVVVFLPAGSVGPLLFGAAFTAFVVGVTEVAEAVAMRRRLRELSDLG